MRKEKRVRNVAEEVEEMKEKTRKKTSIGESI